jgi:hypothetical protein
MGGMDKKGLIHRALKEFLEKHKRMDIRNLRDKIQFYDKRCLWKRLVSMRRG